MGMPWARYLSDDGTRTGNKNANGDYSLAVEEWYLEAAANERLKVARIIVAVEDTFGFSAVEYGNLGSALANGIEIKVVDHNDVVQSDLTDGRPVTDNAHWAEMCYDADVKTWGTGNEVLVVRWTFTKHGDFVILQPGWRLVVYLNDNLSGLVHHYFLAEGI